MKTIQLTKGYVTTVDDEDYDELSKFKWCAHINSPRTIYAKRGIRTKLADGKITTRIEFMHNRIMGKADGFVVDHINRNALDNTRANLRWAKHWQNCRNSTRNPGRSGYRGVYLNHQSGWVANIARINTGREHIGCFESKRDAAIAYNKRAIELYGEFAITNQIYE